MLAPGLNYRQGLDGLCNLLWSSLQGLRGKTGEANPIPFPRSIPVESGQTMNHRDEVAPCGQGRQTSIAANKHPVTLLEHSAEPSAMRSSMMRWPPSCAG